MNEDIKQYIMNEIFRDFLVTFTIVSAIFGIIYTYFITRHRERLLIMERGQDLSEFIRKKDTKWGVLKFGILFIGMSLGILMGNLLDQSYDLENTVAYFSMILLFGGVSLVCYFLIENKYKK